MSMYYFRRLLKIRALVHYLKIEFFVFVQELCDDKKKLLINSSRNLVHLSYPKCYFLMALQESIVNVLGLRKYKFYFQQIILYRHNINLRKMLIV